MKFRLTFTGNFLRVVYPLPALESYIIKSTSRTSISTQKPSLSLAFSVVKSLATDMLTFERQDLQYDVSYSGASKGRRQAVCGDRRMTFRPWCFRENTICMASYNGCNGFTWHSFLPLPMIQPAKQLFQLSNTAGSGRICSHFSFRTLRRLVTAFSSFLLITSGTRAHSS